MELVAEEAERFDYFLDEQLACLEDIVDRDITRLHDEYATFQLQSIDIVKSQQVHLKSAHDQLEQYLDDLMESNGKVQTMDKEKEYLFVLIKELRDGLAQKDNAIDQQTEQMEIVEHKLQEYLQLREKQLEDENNKSKKQREKRRKSQGLGDEEYVSDSDDTEKNNLKQELAVTRKLLLEAQSQLLQQNYEKDWIEEVDSDGSIIRRQVPKSPTSDRLAQYEVLSREIESKDSIISDLKKQLEERETEIQQQKERQAFEARKKLIQMQIRTGKNEGEEGDVDSISEQDVYKYGSSPRSLLGTQSSFGSLQRPRIGIKSVAESGIQTDSEGESPTAKKQKKKKSSGKHFGEKTPSQIQKESEDEGVDVYERLDRQQKKDRDALLGSTDKKSTKKDKTTVDSKSKKSKSEKSSESKSKSKKSESKSTSKSSRTKRTRSDDTTTNAEVEHDSEESDNDDTRTQADAESRTTKTRDLGTGAEAHHEASEESDDSEYDEDSYYEDEAEVVDSRNAWTHEGEPVEVLPFTVNEEGVVVTEDGVPVTEEQIAEIKDEQGEPIKMEELVAAIEEQEQIKQEEAEMLPFKVNDEGVVVTEEGAPITQEQLAKITDERGAPIKMEELVAVLEEQEKKKKKRRRNKKQRKAAKKQRERLVDKDGTPVGSDGRKLTEEEIVILDAQDAEEEEEQKEQRGTSARRTTKRSKKTRKGKKKKSKAPRLFNKAGEPIASDGRKLTEKEIAELDAEEDESEDETEEPSSSRGHRGDDDTEQQTLSRGHRDSDTEEPSSSRGGRRGDDETESSSRPKRGDRETDPDHPEEQHRHEESDEESEKPRSGIVVEFESVRDGDSQIPREQRPRKTIPGDTSTPTYEYEIVGRYAQETGDDDDNQSDDSFESGKNATAARSRSASQLTTTSGNKSSFVSRFDQLLEKRMRQYENEEEDFFLNLPRPKTYEKQVLYYERKYLFLKKKYREQMGELVKYELLSSDYKTQFQRKKEDTNMLKRQMIKMNKEKQDAVARYEEKLQKLEKQMAKLRTQMKH